MLLVMGGDVRLSHDRRLPSAGNLTGWMGLSGESSCIQVVAGRVTV